MQIGEQGCVTSIDFVAIMKLAEFYVPLLPNNFKPIFFDKKKRKLLILKRFHDAIHK